MNRVAVSARMVTREILRNTTAVSLLFLVPTILYVLIRATTGGNPVPFQLSADRGVMLMGSERTLSLLFMGSTAMCGLMAFLSFVLTWRPIQTDRRLVFEGFPPGALLGAKTLVVAATSAILALYVSGLLLFFYHPPRPGGVWLGFFFGGLSYGLLGILLGILSRRELDGILAILLLVNVDPGWLQNPVFYAGAHNRAIIDWLPSHHPCQLTMLSVFTEKSLGPELLRCGAWVAAIGLLAAAGYRWRIGVARHRTG
jgi:ABC-2 type transport system permease protein